MATAKRLAAPPLWPIEARLAALLPDLLVFRKPRGSEPELATAQGVLLGVHVTGFTALMDRFSLSCKLEHDMDRLARIFSYYISDIVEHVLCFGGDILNITGLSAGRISQFIVGDEQRQYLLVIGRDVDGVQLAQRLAQANEIVLSWNCWKLCEQYMFEVEIMREDEAVKIDEGQPMEYISEFRTVTIVLVSLEFHKTAWMLHLCHLIQEAALYISTVIEKGGGQLSRIFMFETGCMFLCVFGLPGDKKPDECAHALESSFNIFSFCWENLAETKLVSISITNGPVFCGMVGAVSRHEYTDREKELEAFRMAQQECLHQKKGQAVLYEGGKGCGKSQLLAEINFLAQKEGHRVLPLKLKKADSKQCFYAIQTLMAIFFEIDTCPAHYRQERLHKQLCGIVEEPLHCLFNDLFFVKAVRETPLIFLIDEAQYMDAASWEFLGTLLSAVPVIMVMTLTPTSTLCGQAQHFLQTPPAVLVPISKLAATSLLRMACWELGVVSIPQELQIYLLRRCFGNPLYCEVLCQDLLSKNILSFHDLQKEEVENSKWETLSANAVKSTMYSISPASSEGQELYVCTVKDDVNLDTVLLPPLLKGRSLEDLKTYSLLILFSSEIAVNQLDQLSPEEQSLVKCAAVIGHSFHIDLLQHLLPGWSKTKLLEVLKDLVDVHVLRWCSKGQALPAEPMLVPSSVETEHTKEETKSDTSQFQTESSRSQEAFTREYCRTEEEFLDKVNRKLAQTNPKKGMLTTKPCHCREVLKRVLSPLTQHCLVIGETTCAFYYLLESAAASLDLSDNYMVCFNMGQITLAKKLARRALRLLKRSFPWTWLGVIFQTFLEKCWYSCSLSQPRNNPSEKKKKLAVLQQQLHCLSLLRQLYSLEATASSRRFACLATLMQKNSVKEFPSEAQAVSTYVALSQFSQNVGDKDEWLHREQLAIQKSSLCWFSREGLLATAQLMQALAYTKLCLGHLDFSIKLGFQAHEICRHLKKPALENLVLSVLFRSAFLKKKFDLCVHVLESQWALISQSHDVLGQACFYSACLDLLLYGKGWLCRPFGECLHFIQHYEHSCILNSQSNVMLGVHSSLAMWFAQDSQWNQFEYHFSKARQLVKGTDASLFGSHGFVRFLECHVLVLQKMPEDVFLQTLAETRRQTLTYFKEFFSRCVTCPVYHQWVSELKAFVMRNGKMSLTNIIRPFDTCLTRIWIEGEFLEENNSFEQNLEIQRFVREAGVNKKDKEEIQECIC
ncbi:hypothetical protein G4228_004835 [Cervus hanglu yarkandensis]|nr:hypothetical protein G4228_004835 [Cervus hanglu yarkandensis]